MKQVLITGANGLVGTILRERLAGRYELVSLTRRPVEFPSRIADVADLDALLPTFAGIDAVVHLAGDPSPSARWESVLRNNVVGTYNVYEAARRQGVGAVVLASTNHSQAMWEVQEGAGIYATDDARRLAPDDPFRPDSFYGWSKASGESLGRYYSDVHGLRVFCLRIGWVFKSDDPTQMDTSGETVPPLPAAAALGRGRAIYLSHRDCAELVRCCLDADHIHFGVYYGVSNNPGRFYDLTNARDEIGYVPQDAAPAGG
jgi:nucleoside-diphosphate-sugar epimerase